MERNCTLLLHGKEATPPNEEEIRELLEVQAAARHPLHRRASGRVAQTAAFSARPLTPRALYAQDKLPDIKGYVTRRQPRNAEGIDLEVWPIGARALSPFSAYRQPASVEGCGWWRAYFFT